MVPFCSTAFLADAEASVEAVAGAQVAAGMMYLKASTMADCMSQSGSCCGAVRAEPETTAEPECRIKADVTLRACMQWWVASSQEPVQSCSHYDVVQKESEWQYSSWVCPMSASSAHALLSCMQSHLVQQTATPPCRVE